MRTSETRILTTHVGSLPRSEAMLELLQRREQDPSAALPQFGATAREAVAAIVQRQVDIGIDAVSDGETSKISYASYVKDRLTGFSAEGSNEPPRPHLDLAPFPDLRRRMALLTGSRPFKRVACVGSVKYCGHAALDRDLASMKAAVATAAPVDAFLNAASPGVVASFLPNRHYASHEAYVEAVAAAMREEYEAIVAAGFVLQIDCPDLAMSRHTAFQDLSEEQFLRRMQFHIEVLNGAIAKIPPDRLRVHICWGNYEGPHTHDVPLTKIIQAVLAVNAGAISLEAANPRHDHEWSVWNEVPLPDDKILLPGVIDTSTNYVEHPELVAQRIVRFARLLGRDRVIASTDCGFGTAAGYGKIDPEIAFLKLAALVEGAVRASDQLWP